MNYDLIEKKFFETGKDKKKKLAAGKFHIINMLI